jgi:thioredoxin reductase (NADPH)
MSTEKVKCLIIGSGPAGYTAAIYASRANLFPVLYEGLQPGGQLTTTTDVENFPGYPDGVSGFQMMEDIRSQALRFGADIRPGDIEEVDFSSRPFIVKTNEGDEILAKTVIIATGATAKYLGLPSEEKFKGQGVSACATCDGFFYKKKDVAVVGGGDTACEEATYLAGLCNKVYMIVRRNVLRASKTMQDRVLKNSNIVILWEHRTKEILGDENGVSAVLLTDKNGNEKVVDIHGFFLAIGHHPNSDIFKKYVETDEMGYILTKGKTTATSVPGVFAAGDVQDSQYRQGITAAATGCMAAKDAESFLMDNE